MMGGASYGETDSASVYVVATSKNEVRRYNQKPEFKDGVWFEYDDIGGELQNEKADD